MKRELPLSRLMKDRRGNFAMMTALVIPVVLAAGGVAIDLTEMVMTKAKLQDATDSAALAAASAMASGGFTQQEAKLQALSFLKTQLDAAQAIDKDGNEGGGENEDNVLSGTQIVITEAATIGSGKSYKVEVSASYKINFNAMTRLLGQESTTLGAQSVAESATESKNALSMFLVLDRSGSMAWVTDSVASQSGCWAYNEARWPNAFWSTPCYVSKIASLKLATASLFTQLSIADPKGEYVRTGAVSYNDAMQKEVNLAWGMTGALNYVNALPSVPTGGTDSSAAFKTAYQKVTASTENTAHKSKNGQTPTKYIVFMTDGQNTHLNGSANKGNASDTETKVWCDKAKADKIEVYTVAFLAPDSGQKLLKYCATSPSYYFEVDDMDALVDAFKAIGDKAAAVVSRLTH